MKALTVQRPTPRICDNQSGPRGAGNTIEGLTHSSDFTREGLAMEPTQTTDRRTPIDLSTACQPWTGSLSSEGYGQVMIDGKILYVHRVAYQLHVGPIHRGWETDHLCHNAAFDLGACPAGRCAHRACFNPGHLDAVPGAVNAARGGHPLYAIARGDVCGRNHDLTDPANVYTYPSGKRRCRACATLAQHERRTR